MTNHTTESEKTPQKPPNALITAFSGATIHATIFPPPSIENIYDIIDFVYLTNHYWVNFTQF